MTACRDQETATSLRIKTTRYCTANWNSCHLPKYFPVARRKKEEKLELVKKVLVSLQEAYQIVS